MLAAVHLEHGAPEHLAGLGVRTRRVGVRVLQRFEAVIVLRQQEGRPARVGRRQHRL
jgi:hypothetical protein